MMPRPKKGDRLVYTGTYASLDEIRALGVLDPEPIKSYPSGTVVSFHTNPFHGPSVSVLLDPQPGDTQDLYADWPISETAPAPDPNVGDDR